MLEPSYPGGDAICPSCGQLLWWFRDRFGETVEMNSSFLDDLGADSLDIVELVMELEEEFHITIPDEEAEQIKTVEDAIRFIGGGGTKSELETEKQMASDIGSIFDLTPPEKLQLVGDLWDDLAATPEAVPIHDWQKEELAKRKANLQQNPASGSSWEEVKRRIRSRYGR